MFRITRTHATLLAALVMAAVGCQTRSMYRTEVNLRDALNDMYTDQAMDNLVRAHEGLPFVQMAYSSLVIQSTDTFNAGFTQSFNGSETVARGATGLLTSTSNVVGRTFGMNASANRAKLTSFHAEPVINQNDVYEAYLAFASNPNFLAVSDHKPDCSVICQKQCHNKWFYIPVESGNAFQDLVLRTALMRGPETVPPGFYDVQIQKITFKDSEAKPGTVIVQLFLSAAVPSGPGVMVFKVDGRTVKLQVFASTEKPVANGVPTTQIETQFNPKTMCLTTDDFQSKHVHIYSYLYPPEAPTTSTFEQQVLNTLENIRANVSTTNLPR